MRRILHIAFIALVASLCVVSCRHIELYDPSSGLYLVFEFEEDRNVDDDGSGSKGETTVAEQMAEYIGGYRVLFYDPVQNYFVYDEVLPSQGGFVHVEPGTYDIIAYGVGSEVVRTKGLGVRGSAYAYVEEIGASLMFTKAGQDGEPDVHLQFPIINMPDGFVVGTMENVYVPGVINDEQTARVEVTVRRLVEDWTFEAVNIEGAENITAMNCYVTGQLEGRYMWDSRYEHSVSAIGFNVKYDPATNSIRGKFNTFGKHPQALSNVLLNITVLSAYGGYYQWIYDISDQFDAPDNWTRKLVVKDPIVIPAGDGGGVTPSVDDWSAVVITIPID